MRSIIKYFIDNTLAANLLMVGILIMGFFGLMNTKKSFFPEVKDKFIVVQATYIGASPEEVEEGVVSKVEEAIKGVSNVERITSKSSENVGIITIETVEKADVDIVLTDVKNAVDAISSFPVNVESIQVFKQELLLTAVFYAISGDVDLKSLKQYARQIEEDLLSIDGISKVSLQGIPDEEIEIAFREVDLRTYKLSFAEATRAVQGANLNITSGTIKGEKEDLLLRANNKGYTASEFRDIVVKTSPNGSLVKLHQVADITDKWVDNPDRAYINGETAIRVTVKYTKNEDIVHVAENTKAYMADFAAKNPGVTATMLADDSQVISKRIDLLIENGLVGFLLVIILLAMFLNWRLAFWVALAIPISFAGMFIFVPLFGESINVVSSFGMIMVLGILVDDGIVICESIYSKYEEGNLTRTEAAIEGTMEVLPAVTGAILTTMLAFGSFFFVAGQIGEYFSSLAVFVLFALAFSLIEGALILPSHVAHSHALDPEKKSLWLVTKFDGFMRWLRDSVYAPVLRFSMHNKFLVFSTIFSVFILTISAIQGGIIKQTFFPNVELNNLNVDLQMPSGTSVDITEKWLAHIEQAAWEVNEELTKEYMPNGESIIENIQKTVGPSSNVGGLNLLFIDVEKRRAVTGRIVSEAIRKRAGEIAGAEQLTYGAQLNFGKPVSLSLVGTNSEELKLATQMVKDELNALAELRDITDTNKDGLKEIKINLKEKAKYLGLNLQDIAGQVRQGYFGNEVQRLQRGKDEVRVWVRYAKADRKNVAQLEEMRIRLADGRAFPLKELATLEEEVGILAIDRLDGKRQITIEADIADNDVSVTDQNNNIKDNIAPKVEAKFSSVTALMEGQERETAKTSASFALVGPIVLILMFFIIALTFKSISQTLVVFMLIPFCYIGVGWGHWFMDKPISLLSNQGVLALIGILVNDALVFISTYNTNLKKGIPQMDALYTAGLSRFRPIVLTSVTTVAGLAPLLLDPSLGAQFVIPMAISVAFGLIFITVIILVLLPVFIIATNRIKVYAQWLWEGKKPSLESVESAVKNQQTFA
ncbi:MAG: efflux RND transporter permease subunit [Saprospiraceae bacterium]